MDKQNGSKNRTCSLTTEFYNYSRKKSTYFVIKYILRKNCYTDKHSEVLNYTHFIINLTLISKLSIENSIPVFLFDSYSV